MTTTISTTIHTPIVLYGNHDSQLSITATGDVAPTYGNGITALSSKDSINNAGTVSGAPGYVGVLLTYGSLTNDGMILGGAGVGSSSYGSGRSKGGTGDAGVVIRASAAGTTNTGTIVGGVGGTDDYLYGYGGIGGAGVSIAGGRLKNEGTIDGGTGGHGLNGPGSGGAGIYLNGGTVINAGTVAGGAGGYGFVYAAPGNAVQFGTASGTLVIDPGAVFIGKVVADAGAADVLVLASATTTGTLSGLGSKYAGFSSLIEDAGANWIFTGSNTLEGMALMAGDLANEGLISGDASLTVTGQLINDETISLGTGLTLTGHLSNKGTITGETGEFGAASGGNGSVAVYMKAGVLINAGLVSGGYGGRSGTLGTGGVGGTGLDFVGGTVTNQSTIYGGTGGQAYHGGAAGAGVAMSGGSLTNDQTITGGLGGTGNDGDGGAGGTGVAMTGGSLSNSETITGGAGGYGGGAGGAGVSLSAGTLTNNKAIRGGAGGIGYNGGAGGAGVDISGGSLGNLNTIDGGAGGGRRINGGRGGAGIYLNGGTVTNQGTIAGGAPGTGSNDGAPGDAVQFGTASGTLVIDPSAVFIGKVAADASAEDVLVLASPNAGGGTLSGLGSQFTGFSVLDFTPNARWTVEGSAAAFASLQSINNFAHGDTIVLDGFADNPADTTYVTGVGLELTDTSGNQVTLDIVEPAGATTANFSVTDPEAETTITYTACFAAGTRILCANGRLARVENLREGDAVELFDGTAAPIIWIGVRTLDLRRHPRPADVQPILITRGALGNGLPWNDLVVSPDHGMYLQDHLIPAKTLLNGFTVRQLNRTAVTYYHLELPNHAVIFAEGAPAETYLESGNRGAFENGGAAVILHPDFANSWRLAGSCAPLVEDGHVVESVRAGILQRAAIATTDDPALSIDYDNGAAFISSRAAVPGEIFADPRDRRRLGVKVARLTIGGNTVRLDHPKLAEGWHDLEPDGRWTDGRALIPPCLIPVGAHVAVELAAAMRYPSKPRTAILPRAAR